MTQTQGNCSLWVIGPWFILLWRIDEVNLYLLWSCENIFWSKLAGERPPKVCIQLFQILYISFYEVILHMNKYIETSKTYCYKNHLTILNSRFFLGDENILITLLLPKWPWSIFNKIARFHLNKNFEQQKYWENIACMQTSPISFVALGKGTSA